MKDQAEPSAAAERRGMFAFRDVYVTEPRLSGVVRREQWTRTQSQIREAPLMQSPMPTLVQLRKAREEFKRIEPRDFFYWSVTKLVAAVLDTESRTGVVDELVRVLMMLLTTWNKNYYRFFNGRKAGMSLENHFAELETVILLHFDGLLRFRKQRIDETATIPEEDIRSIFEDFSRVLGRVGAAKCLHLLAPTFFPLWDAAILKGYGLDKGEYRHRTDAERYVAFIAISKTQIDTLGDFSSFTDNPLKSLDEYNYCRFTKGVDFGCTAGPRGSRHELDAATSRSKRGRTRG